MKTLNLLAFDIGASNGRGIIGAFDGKKIELIPVGNFENNFVSQGAMGYWDYENILSNLKACFVNAKKEGLIPDCFGIDTWGVDYGLLDKDHKLIENPRAYRISTDEEMLAAWQKISKRELFDITGLAALNFNTVYQLYRRVLENDPALQQAETLLFTPDLLGYGLSGEIKSEYTMASTSGLLDVKTGNWSKRILNALDIPEKIFLPLDKPGTLRGSLKADLASEMGLPRVAYAAVGGHDTASAVAAIPGRGDFAFCSSGTWSLFGVESDTPVLSDFVYENSFSNEGTVQGGFRPLKNIMGLWLVQECRREWTKETGKKLDWEYIKAEAVKAEPFRSIIDPDYPAFYKAGNMREKIRDYCQKTGQPQPETIGQFARACYESLALKYRWAVERLGEMKGKPLSALNITGGGIQNLQLNQMAADSTGLVTTVGPIEGAAMGNALMQAVALGEISDLSQAREVVRASVETQVYEPNHTQAWDDAYGRMMDNAEKMKEDIG
ncbi:MAG: rhamnulokinase family protein [Bacillota bacterium]|nr:rhamnulokinase family protein [Bacillota bacterium]